MNSDTEFAELIGRVKAGEEAAAAELVRRYEPEIRRFIRFRLTSSSVRRFVDSFDICQSVLGRFFTYLDERELDVSDPQKLIAILRTITRNKIVDVVAREQAGRRDVRRLTGGGEERLAEVADERQSPSQLLSAEEVIGAVYRVLDPADRNYVEARMNGQEWSELAAGAGCTAEAMRKRVNRAIERAAQQLGLV